MLDPWASAIAHLSGTAGPPATHWPNEHRRMVVCPDPPDPLDDWVPPGAPRQCVDDQVLELLAGGAMTVSAAAKAMQCKVSTMSMRLARMAQRGLVEKTQAGFRAAGKQPAE